jgi:hypothetical protein
MCKASCFRIMVQVYARREKVLIASNKYDPIGLGGNIHNLLAGRSVSIPIH